MSPNAARTMDAQGQIPSPASSVSDPESGTVLYRNAHPSGLAYEHLHESQGLESPFCLRQGVPREAQPAVTIASQLRMQSNLSPPGPPDAAAAMPTSAQQPTSKREFYDAFAAPAPDTPVKPAGRSVLPVALPDRLPNIRQPLPYCQLHPAPFRNAAAEDDSRSSGPATLCTYPEVALDALDESAAFPPRRWLPKEDAIMIELRGRNMNWPNISKRLTRSAKSCCQRYYYLSKLRDSLKVCTPCCERKTECNGGNAKCDISSFCLNVQPPSPSSNTLVHPQQLSRAAEQYGWDLAAPKPAMISLQASREEHPGEDEHNSELFSMPGMTDEEVWKQLWDSLRNDDLSFRDRGWGGPQDGQRVTLSYR